LIQVVFDISVIISSGECCVDEESFECLAYAWFWSWGVHVYYGPASGVRETKRAELDYAPSSSVRAWRVYAHHALYWGWQVQPL